MIKSLGAIIIAFLTFAPLISQADAPAWQIINKESSIHFTAIQNSSPVTGQFTSFAGEINADPNQLNTSHVKIIVNLASVTTSYNQVADTLKTADWFNIKIFPHAIFEAKQFTKTGKYSYQAQGTLSIRDKTQPITLNFIQEQLSPEKSRVKGTTLIKRTAFGVGQGDWASTDAIKDNVKVDFVLTAMKK